MQPARALRNGNASTRYFDGAVQLAARARKIRSVEKLLQQRKLHYALQQFEEHETLDTLMKHRKIHANSDQIKFLTMHECDVGANRQSPRAAKVSAPYTPDPFRCLHCKEEGQQWLARHNSAAACFLCSHLRRWWVFLVLEDVALEICLPRSHFCLSTTSHTFFSAHQQSIS